MATETITMTAATPMITPSTARKLRSASHLECGDRNPERSSNGISAVPDHLPVAEGDALPRADGGFMRDDDHGDAGPVQILEQRDDLLG